MGGNWLGNLQLKVLSAQGIRSRAQVLGFRDWGLGCSFRGSGFEVLVSVFRA